MSSLTIRVSDVAIRLTAEDSRFIASARRRYRPFVTNRSPQLRLQLELVRESLRPHRTRPRVVWDGRAGRIERHDLELDLAPGIGRATIVRAPSPLDSLLRIALSFELAKRGGFLCHSAAVDGWLFPGLSGAGKSTLGRAAPKNRLLADELVGVVGSRLWGTPFRGDFLPGKNPRSRPLQAIFLLDRHGPRGVAEVPKTAALVRILRCALYFGNDAGDGGRILAAARRSVLGARTFALSYDARKTAFAGVEAMIRRALR
ncbi:MAG TPA: hypothetical protein VMU54_09460 [Planctomycetota bacterium]|nr:hypothetical protein [Planctomycetota bacterium]